MNQYSKLALIAAIAAIATSASAQSASTVQSVPATQQAENSNWVNGNNEYVWMNGTGEYCLRSSFWTPATANKGCDGALAETPVPPAPAPAPVPVPPVPSEKVTYHSEVLFDFDKTELKPEAKQKLDEFIAKVKGIDNLEIVVVTGHTDEIGRDAYNNRLSVRRAEAGKGYLVSSGIDENHVYTEGKGKSNPIVTNCRKKLAKAAKKSRNALIRCLAPNRRIEIEAVGTIKRAEAGSTGSDASAESNSNSQSNGQQLQETQPEVNSQQY